MNLPWLYDHRHNVTSQHGEDGVIEAILSRIGEENRWCVDIGANDGVTISNSHYWCAKQGWSGVMVEADAEPFASLCDVYDDRQDVHCFHEFATVDNVIDTILARTPCPQRPDILSIDIDGMDFWLWHGLERYRPRVVIIEVNATMAPDVHVVQQDPRLQLGSSALAMVTLARDKGYELAAHLVSNCIFVEAAEYPLLGIADNKLPTLFTSPFVPTVVSDLNGMHYVLKPGPWGFSGAQVAPDMYIGEDGELLARRLLQRGGYGGGPVVRLDTERTSGYAAAFVQDPEIRRVTRRFVTRDWSQERAAILATDAADVRATGTDNG